MNLHQAEIPRHGLCIVNHGTKAPHIADSKAKHHDNGDGHNDALQKIGGAGRQKPSQSGIGNDDNRTYHHGRHIIPPEQTGKQFSACRKTRSGIRYKENDNQNSRQHRQDLFLIPVTVGKKQGQCGGIAAQMRVAAKPSCHHQPVYISSDCQADGCPGCVRETGHIGDARKAHQKPAAHIRCFRTHGGDEGTQLSSPQIKVFGGTVFPGKDHAHTHHHGQIGNDGKKHQ